MKNDLRAQAELWNSFLYTWSMVLFVATLIAAALWAWENVRWLLWLSLAAFVGAKIIRVLEIAFLMKEAGVGSRLYLMIVNLALGGGAAYILADLLGKHLGI